MKLQITIEKLQRIIDAAQRAKKLDSSLSDTLEIEATSPVDTHTGSDRVGVLIKSSYQECFSIAIFNN